MNATSTDLPREGYSVADASNVTGIGRTKIYEAIAKGHLTARKVGKRTIILRGDLHSFLEGLPVSTVSIAAA